MPELARPDHAGPEQEQGPPSATTATAAATTSCSASSTSTRKLVIAHLATLSVAEKAVVLRNYRKRIADPLNAGKMARAVRTLGCPLATKLWWAGTAGTPRLPRGLAGADARGAAGGRLLR